MKKANSVVMAAALCAAMAGSAVHADDPWADGVVAYTAGSGGAPGFDDASTVLGMPTRSTSPQSQFGGPTTPFQSAFGADELLSLGEGGSVTVRFDTPITDDPANPFGIDLLVFGNAFFFDQSFPDGIAGQLSAEGGVVEVSADGVDWREVTGVQADGLFPTLGYSDVTEPFPTDPAFVETDFTRPVDPSFDPTGLTLSQIIAGYNGSGGGAGIDLAAVGLSSASFVRVTNPVGSGVTPEIDGFADVVPAPGSALVLAMAGLTTAHRRRGSRRG